MRAHSVFPTGAGRDGLVAALMIPVVRTYSPLLLVSEGVIADVATCPAAAVLDVLLAVCRMHERVETRHCEPVFISNSAFGNRQWAQIHRKALLRQQRAATGW
jgi:hypothetical protein